MNYFLRRGFAFILLLALCSGHLLATPTCPIITQSFQNPDGTKVDTTATGWYVDSSALVNPAYFGVKSNRFTAQNIGGVGVWYSRIFSVSGYASFQVAIKITAEGLQNNSEYVKLYYKLNGGPEVLYAQDSANFGTIDFTSAALTGNTIQLIVRIYDYNNGSGQASKYYIEQYRVFKESGTCTPATIPVSAAVSSSGNTISCTTTSVSLAASSTASGVSYSWAGPGGFTSTSRTPTVTAPGTYEVVASNSSGYGTAVVTVLANNTPPDLTASGAALGCSSSVTLNAASSVSGATYSWSGPGTFSSTSATPTATALGTYTVTVRNPANGCTTSQQVQVVTGNGVASTFWNENFSLPDGTTVDTGTTAWSVINTTTGTFAVASNEFKINNLGNTTVGTWTSGTINISGRTNVGISVDVRSGVSSGGALESSGSSVDSISLYYILNGGTPVQFSSNLGTINSNRTTDTTISFGSLQGSTLQVMVRARTTSSDEFYYFDNVKVSGILQTNITASATASGAVGCSADSVTLQGSSNTAGVSYAWTGPNSFSSSLQNPKVHTAGSYVLVVINSGGCQASATATVAQGGTGLANVTASTSKGTTLLTCTDSSLVLLGSSSSTTARYSWTGPNGFTASGASVSAAAAGSYTLTATDTSTGCSGSTTIALQSNKSAPAGVTSTPTPASALITCAVPNVLLSGSSATGTVRYSWTGPNNYTASTASASVTAPGTYVLTATDSTNGCKATASTVVTQNILSPEGVTANGSNQITCDLPQVNLVGSSTTPGVTYSWTGPNGFSASGAVVPTTAGGSYTLTVTNPANGCIKTLPTTISQNTAPPAGVTATNSGPLTCDVTSVTITGTSTSPNVEYEWNGPDGYLSFSAQDIATEGGDYILTVTNDDNGCTLNDTTNVQNICGPARKMTAASSDTTLTTTGFEWKTYPNPFNNVAFVEFRLPESDFVTVQVYNNNGVTEKILFSNKVAANQWYKLTLTGTLPAGIHYFTIRVNNKIYTRKLVSIK